MKEFPGDEASRAAGRPTDKDRPSAAAGDWGDPANWAWPPGEAVVWPPEGDSVTFSITYVPPESTQD